MAEHCENCGSELFIGQRFCRSCGRPATSEEHMPTQQMPPTDARGPRGQVNTAPPSRPDTSPVYNPQPTYQPPSYPPMYGQYPAQTYPPPPAQSRSPWGWIIALIGIGLFAFIVLGIFVGIRAGRQAARSIPPPPPAPEQLSGTTINEAGPVSIPLNKDAVVSLKNISGNITVEVWDEPNAELRVIKRGGSAREQRDARVVIDSNPGKLSLQMAPARGNSNVVADYVLKLPRQVGKIELSGVSSDLELRGVTAAQISLNTTSGSIEVVDATGDVIAKTASGEMSIGSVKGNITASSQSGAINITDVTGTANTTTVSGKTDVMFESLAPGGPLDFKSMSGSINIRFQDEPDIDLTADTVSGNIDLNGDFDGVEVEKRMVGARASGRVGNGGLPFRVKSVSGGIELSK